MTENSLALRVLVVDDEALIRWSLTETLTRAGCSVVEAGNAKETLARLADGWVPDVILLDFRLPDMNNLNLLGAIRHQLPRCPIVMMTAFGTPEVVEGAERLGARVIGKPVQMSALVPLVRHVYESGLHRDASNQERRP